MNNKNCYICNSNSTVLDNAKWVCYQHIDVCKCVRNHQSNVDWDFNQQRSHSDGYMIETMESQSPDVSLNNI